LSAVFQIDLEVMLIQFVEAWRA